MSELKNPGYWIGHLLAVVATIIGVYYAAIVGFDVAVRLELVKADRGTYYVAESLYQELSFNVSNMERYIQRVANEPYVFKEHLSGIKMNDFAFNASKYSDSVFEIEPTLLSELSIYYFSVGSAIEDYYQSGMASPQKLISVIKKETKKLQGQKTLERLAAYNEALAATVEKRGVSLTQPSFSIE